MKTLSPYTKYIFVLVSILLAGFFLMSAARGFSNQGKYVEVKGLSERIVKADRGIWSMSVDVKSNDINDLYAQIDSATNTISNFLLEKGFEEGEFNAAPVNVYQDTYREAAYRYNGSLNMSVYTDKVDLLRSSSKETLDLIRKGIVFNSNYTNFEFSDINSIKSDMLGEAILNARSSAQKFADDANTRLIGISRGNQGVFTITDKDPASPEYKKIRVVSTLRYMLK